MAPLKPLPPIMLRMLPMRTQWGLSKAPFGIVGLETALGLSLRLVEEGVLSLESMIEKLTSAPARLLGLSCGTLAAGAQADVVLIDPRMEWTVDPERFRSKGRNSPFAGVATSRCGCPDHGRWGDGVSKNERRIRRTLLESNKPFRKPGLASMRHEAGQEMVAAFSLPAPLNRTQFLDWVERLFGLIERV